MRPDALLFDLDGTLYLGDEAIPGAVEAIRRLDALGVPHRFLTNTTRFSRQELAERLQRMGFPVAPVDLFTAPVAAASWLRREGVRRAMLCLPAGSHADFPEVEITEGSPEAVVVGDLGAAWTFERLNRAFRAVLHGAHLLALQKNRYWMTPAGLMLDAGPFVAALEYATGRRAVVVGKPAPDFFLLAAASLGIEPSRITVVGDDLAADIGGAAAVGMRGALVRTGKFRQEELDRSDLQADEVGDDVGTLVRGWFGE